MEWLFSWEVASWFIAGLIGAALAFLALDDFRLAKLFFLLAAANAVGGVAMWGSRADLSVWQRYLSVFLLTGGIGILCLCAFRYVETKRKAKDKPQPTEEVNAPINDQPSIQASLVIDSVTVENIGFHVEIQNGPLFPVKNIRYTVGTPDASDNEFQSPLPRMLAPSGKLTLPTPPAATGFLKFRQFNTVIVTVFYTNGDKQREKEFICKCRFLFDSDQTKAGAIISPEAVEQRPSQISDHEANFDSLFLQLAKNRGSLAFPAFEVVNQKPNIIRIENDKRTFLFDPIARVVSFKTKTQSGKWVVLEQPLRQTERGGHIIFISWDESKGRTLSVDGVASNGN
jgi:uncharacterized membrane protein YidH (DUF202 family)